MKKRGRKKERDIKTDRHTGRQAKNLEKAGGRGEKQRKTFTDNRRQLG